MPQHHLQTRGIVSPHGIKTRGASSLTCGQANTLWRQFEATASPLCPNYARSNCRDRGRSTFEHRNPGDVGKGLHIQHTVSAQEGRGSETHDKLDEAQQTCTTCTCTFGALQDGKNSSFERFPTKRRLDDKKGPEGCLFHCSDTEYSGIGLQFLAHW